MVAQCPQCGSPRQGDRAFCDQCGFDYRTTPVAAQIVPEPPAPAPLVDSIAAPIAPVSPFSQPPFSQPPVAQQFGQGPSFGQPSPFSQPAEAPVAPVAPVAPQFQAPQQTQAPFPPQAPYGQQPQAPFQQPQAPFPPQGPYGQQYAAPGGPTCPRCHATVYPGYPLCGNCGLDLRQFGPVPMAPMGAPVARKSSLPTFAAIAGVVMLVVAGGLFFLNQQKTPGVSPTASASLIAVATSSPTPTIAPTDTPEATPDATETATLAPDITAEPAPVGTWTKYTSSDKKWSVKFPGIAAPLKQTMSGTGTVSMNMTYYYTIDTAGTLYAVYALNSSALRGMSGDGLLTYMKDYMQSYLSSAMGATVTSTSDLTISGKPAIEMVSEGNSIEIVLDMLVVGPDVYMLMVAAAPGNDLYPKYFQDSFAAK